MRFLSRIVLVFSLVVFAVASMSSIAQAQTKKDAIEAFNQGYELAKKGQTQAAINKFEESASLSQKVGPDAKEIMDKAQDQLPSLYYQLAIGQYRKQDMQGAIDAFQKAEQVADKYGNKEIAQRSKANVPKLYYAMGNSALQQGNYQAALDASNKALELEPNNPKPYYQQGLVYKKMKKMDEALQKFDKAIDLAKKANDTVTLNSAQNSAKNYLLSTGVDYQQKKEYSKAIDLLTKSLNYDNSFANAYYRLAETYNKMGQSSKALNDANEALKYEKGSKTDKAKIWFEIGLAEQSMNNKSKACDAFENAAFGSFKASAEYKMEQELKCKQAQPNQ